MGSPESPSGTTWLENAQGWVAFPESPSVTTWLENAQGWVAFPESPSVTTWLENAHDHQVAISGLREAQNSSTATMYRKSSASPTGRLSATMPRRAM